MTAFLRVALVNCLFVVALIAGRVSYDGHIHPAGKAAICAVLAVYCYGAFWALKGRTEHTHLAIRLAPMVALLGSVAGFLIAFSGDVGDVQQRVLGASTGLVATFVGIAAAAALTIQAAIVERP